MTLVIVIVAVAAIAYAVSKKGKAGGRPSQTPMRLADDVCPSSPLRFLAMVSVSLICLAAPFIHVFQNLTDSRVLN